MVIMSEDEYAAALARLEQMFGKVDDEEGEQEFEILIKAIELWEKKMRSN